MDKPQAKKRTAKILAPKVKEGEKEFEIIGVYWFTTFPASNPFIGSPRCNKCRLPTVFERFVGDLHGGAESVYEFSCVSGHRWEYRRTND